MREHMHTPGPWEARGLHEREARINAPGWSQLASVVIRNPGIAAGEGEANARLIAAAPELLAACKGALPFLEGFENDETQETPVGPLVAQVRAAISKAEGV